MGGGFCRTAVPVFASDYPHREVPAVTVVMRQCSICCDERLFEQPPCADDHDPHCPEWVCVDCGTALFLGVVAAAETGASVA